MDPISTVVGGLALGVAGNLVTDFCKYLVRKGLGKEEAQKRLVAEFPGVLTSSQAELLANAIMSAQSGGQVFNVSSNNQSGGVTAGIVNMHAPPQRHVDDAARAKLREILENNLDATQVFVDAVANDPEADSLAHELVVEIQKLTNLPVHFFGYSQFPARMTGTKWGRDGGTLIVTAHHRE